MTARRLRTVFRMDIEILSEWDTPRGRTIVIKIGESKLTILLTRHLLDAAKDYSLEIKSVLYALVFPDEVIRGHSGRFVAHKLLNDYMVRVVYHYEDDIPVVITVYIARKERYFRGGVYEDKILSRLGHT